MSKKTANQCIDAMRVNGTLRDHKIGVVTQDFPGEFPNYHKGEYVIFRDEGDGSVTVEKPLLLSKIEENNAKGSLITTIGTTITVPGVLIKAR